MAYAFDGEAKTITLSAGTTTLVVKDCYSRSKDWLLTHAWSTFPLLATGGNTIRAGLFAGDYYYLQPGWIIVPQDADHILDVVGNLLPAVLDAPLFSLRSGRTIQIPSTISSLTQTVSVGSGVLPADITATAAATRDLILSDGVPFPGARIDATISSVGGGYGGLTVEQAASLAQVQARVAEVWQMLWLDPANPVTATEVSAAETTIAFGDVSITISKSGAVTTMTRQP